MSGQLIEVEAENIEEAREKVKQLTPSGCSRISEKIISHGKPQTVQGVAETVEEAFAKAQNRIPQNGNIVEQRIITTPKTQSLIVEGIDESSARWQMTSKYGNEATLKELKLLKTGSRGLLGIGAKPNQYELTIAFLASVEIAYQSQARLTVEVSEINFKELEAKGDIRSLIVVLGYDSIFDARAAATALGRIGGDDAVQALVKTLESPKTNSKLAAALALAMLKDERAIEPLIGLLEDKTDFMVQMGAIESLEGLGDVRAIKPLVHTVVTDKNKTVVQRAMRALLKLDHLAAMDPLVVALNRRAEDYHIRMKAAAMLGHLKNEHATDPLIIALRDETWNVRSTAAWALGEIGDRRAVEPLNNLLEDSNYSVKKEARQALASIERSIARKEASQPVARSITIDANHTGRGTINLRIKGGEPNVSYEITYADGTKHNIIADENGRALASYEPAGLDQSAVSGEILINPGGHIMKSQFSQYPGFDD